MTEKRKKQRIIREQIKDRHTSHWDLDMLSREELEALMSAPPSKKDGARKDRKAEEPSNGSRETDDKL